MRPSERSAGPARMRLPSLRLPFRLLRGHIGRLALTLIALAWGVALVCAIDVVNRAVLSAFVEVVDTMAGRAALEIAAGEGALFPEDVATRAAAVPGVELAVPVVTAAAFATDGSGELLSVHGVDVTNDAAIRVYHVRDEGGLPIDDPLVFLSQPDSILLPRSFAGPRGLEARIGQVGVMRALGLRPTDVWLELLAESLRIGAAGVAAGLASGVGLARLMLPVIATTTALASKLTVPSARFVVGWSSLAVAAALGLGATLLAAALPAWRAARASTAAVIGGRGVEQPAHATRLVHIALAASLVAGSAAILLERWTRAASLGLVATFLLAI